MVELIIATHGEYADGILSTLHMVAGNEKTIASFALMEGDDPSFFEERMRKRINDLIASSESDGVLVLVDLLGGTPSNCMVRIMRDLGPEHVRCIAGLNFPMLVEAVFARESKTLPELEASCKEAAINGVIALGDLF